MKFTTLLTLLGLVTLFFTSILAAPIRDQSSEVNTTANATFSEIEANSTGVEERQLPPWFLIFRECKKNDPRPYCPPKRSDIMTEAEAAQIESRQLPPWFLIFRECKKNDPRPYCPRKRSSISSDADLIKREISERQLPPWFLIFRECKKNDPRPYCSHKQSDITSVDPYWATPEGKEDIALFEIMDQEREEWLSKNGTMQAEEAKVRK